MIYCAAGSGHLGVLTILTSQDCTHLYDEEALTSALFIAARQGHYGVALLSHVQERRNVSKCDRLWRANCAEEESFNSSVFEGM